MNTITINGKTISVPSGNSISISNGQVIVDGKKIELDSFEEKEINIQINGDVSNLDITGKVNLKCDMIDSVFNSGMLYCEKIGTVQRNSGIIKGV